MMINKYNILSAVNYRQNSEFPDFSVVAYKDGGNLVERNKLG